MPDANFETWWRDSLPSEMKKGSKPRAARRYNAIVKNGELNALNLALEAYRLDQRSNMWRKFMHGPSFLDRFREWLPDPERPEALADETPEAAGRHLCDICDPSHVYQEDETDRLNWNSAWLYACPKQREKMKEEIRRGLEAAQCKSPSKARW